MFVEKDYPHNHDPGGVEQNAERKQHINKQAG